MSIRLRLLCRTLACGAVLLLAACGQKGDLYLPDQQAATTVSDPRAAA